MKLRGLGPPLGQLELLIAATFDIGRREVSEGSGDGMSLNVRAKAAGLAIRGSGPRGKHFESSDGASWPARYDTKKVTVLWPKVPGSLECYVTRLTVCTL